MSEMPSKVNVSVAVPGKSKKFYMQDHQTTHGFMQPRPIFCREYVPGRDMQVDTKSFVRANPMPVPIFGHCKVYNRAFFVPFRTVARDFNAFYTQTTYSYFAEGDRVPSRVPIIRNDTLVDLFVQNNTLVNNGNSTSFDFCYFNGTQNYYTFTELGIKFITILESLGYKINWQSQDVHPITAMPLLCWGKIMVDWYYPSAYVGSSEYVAINRIFELASAGRSLTYQQVFAILNLCLYSTYEPDYFVNGFDHPTGPNDLNGQGVYNLPDITNEKANTKHTVVSDYNGDTNNNTPYVNSGDTKVLTQYVIDALKTLTDYTKRHQLAGVRVLDRYLAELGISLSNEILNRSCYLGSQEFSMEFYDVFSHSDTYNSGSGDGAVLGAYAGKGSGFGGSKVFSYDNGQEFGMFIIINSINPVTGYYQGQHRELEHVNALDFYHADFDHMAIQPISTREVYVPQNGSVNISGYNQDGGDALNSTIFAYAPKYIEYNTPMDLQTGLYRIKTRNGMLPCYSLMRDLSYYEQGTISQMKHSKGFVVGTDQAQYLRIFYQDKVDEDQFNAIHHFEVTQYDSTLPAYDTYKFEEENKNVQMQINGSKLN